MRNSAKRKMNPFKTKFHPSADRSQWEANWRKLICVFGGAVTALAHNLLLVLDPGTTPPPFFSHCKLWPDVVWALAIVMQKCKHATPTIVLLQDTPTVGGVKTNCIKFAANPWLHLCVTNNILSFYCARNTEQHSKDATVQIVFF